MVDYDPSFLILSCSRIPSRTDQEAAFALSNEFQDFYDSVCYGDRRSRPGALRVRPPYVIRIDVSAVKQKQNDDDDGTKENEELPSDPVFYRHVSKLGTFHASRNIPDGFFRTTQGLIMENRVDCIEYKFTLTLYEWDSRTSIPDDEYEPCGRTKKSACRIM